MDALPGVGHACGHNLIAISGTTNPLRINLASLELMLYCYLGIGVSIAIKKALEKFNLSGTVELLGTPGTDSTQQI